MFPLLLSCSSKAGECAGGKILHIPYKVIIIKKQEKIFLPRSMLDGKINYFWASPCCLLCFPVLQKQGMCRWSCRFSTIISKQKKNVSCLNCDNFSSVWKLLPWAIHFLSPFCLLFSLFFLPPSLSSFMKILPST